MVRKPELVPPPLQQAMNNPPYPTTPPDEHPPPFIHDPHAPDANTYHFVDHEDARRSRSNSSISSSSDWDEPEDDEPEKGRGEIPALLKVGGGRPQSAQTKPSDLPALLRVGPLNGSPAPRISIGSEDDRPQSPESPKVAGEPKPEPVPATEDPRPPIPLQSQNPYFRLQTQSTGQSSYGSEDSNAIWANAIASNAEPVELPLDNNTPVEQISKMSLRDDTAAETQTLAAEEGSTEPMDPTSPVSKPTPSEAADPTSPAENSVRNGSNASSAFYPGMDISSLDALTSRSHGLPSDGYGEFDGRTWQQQQAWEKSERERREREAAEAHETAQQEERERQAEEEWHRGEETAKAAAQSAAQPQEQPPQLPPRRPTDVENPPPTPPRPNNVNIDGTRSAGQQEVETPGTQQQRQRNEHYSIKHIRWFDSRIDNLREAPILTQNANGPCPLLALVNALVLSTPTGQQTALVDTLRTREQVSLGLLLDAVFDELMSGRRGGAAQELPDVSDLYAFLLALHTGMNVNPRFVASSEFSGLIDHPSPLSSARPGGFEETREMRLYSTFNVPLIHGWLPPSESRAYAAFERIAKTYEDAQNVQFHEEELEEKLLSSGLLPQEQSMYEDLQALKDFLQRWPTQLTDYGLNVMNDSLKPGQIAILFRNDHFSTIYKEPRSQKIVSLVTDAGYSSHEEIVWESLVDVTGRGSELFSGDFRPVSHAMEAGQEQPRNQHRNQHRQTAPSNTIQTDAGITSPQESGTVTSTGGATDLNRTEQEDADLALALQLQEEEEDRHRRETEARRRRENELSHNFLSQEASTQTPRPGTTPAPIRDPIRGQDIRPLIPPRRNNVQTHRPAANGEEPPPPTYEQAANSPVYVPGQGLPNPPQTQRPGGGSAHGRGQSAYAATSGLGRGQQSYFLGGEGRGRGGRGGRGGRRTSQPLPLINRIPDGSGTGRGGGAVGAGIGPRGRRQSSGLPAGQGHGQSQSQNQGKDDKCVVM